MLNTFEINLLLMLNLEQVVELLKDRNLREVSRRTGLAYLTVWRISHGVAGNVGYETVVKLSDYLEQPIAA